MDFRKILSVGILMLIGEFIFLLPFVVTRIFRPTFLAAFDINNLQLGTAFSLYGIVAMLAYFFGGPVADRFSPRSLLPTALLVTSLGGVWMATIPSLFVLTLLYGFWGLTTILLFWAAYVKAQRELGGADAQGRSFGAIDAGRGFVAAAIASSSVFLLDAFLHVSADDATTQQLSQSLSYIILIFSGLTASGALLIWFFLPKDIFDRDSMQKISMEGVKIALKRRTVWYQALIVLCSYVGYKCTDDFSLYASVAFNYNDVDAAHIATISFWIRPLAAIAAGLLGDYFLHSKIVAVCFAIMLVGSLFLTTGFLQPGMEVTIILTLATTSVGIYGLRGLYFALFQEAKLPLVITGSAAGVVSVIGYTPDVFMGPLMGWVLDSAPGYAGHQNLFGILAGFSILGMVVTILFRKAQRKF
ncbi:MAG TPA: nitrate/nitrite transporter [Cyclobacteriaceae bacterium]